MWIIKTIPWHKSRRWYCLYWIGQQPISWLKDGRSYGAFKYKGTAMKRCDELNKEGFKP